MNEFWNCSSRFLSELSCHSVFSEEPVKRICIKNKYKNLIQRTFHHANSRINFTAIIILILNLIILSTSIRDADFENNRIKSSRGRGSRWWSLVSEAEAEPSNSIMESRMPDSYIDPVFNTINLPLKKKQRRLIRDNPGVLSAVIKGLKMAISECQFQFKDRRWNCPTTEFMKGGSIFGKIVQKGCRETAFVYALTSAGVTHAVARACSEGQIETCTCDYRNSRRPNGIDWEWGGCSDNIDFGVKFARQFIDSAEKGRDLRFIMNLHNNEAGRLQVQQEMRRECKCHGMSGSCTVKTCWMRLPSFRSIGNNIKDRFDGASRIIDGNQVTSRGAKNRGRFQIRPSNPSHKYPTKRDLVYFEQSPDFCAADHRFGVFGTRGRVCNDTSSGVDGCELMCCGRGYKTELIEELERCNCTFQWCCTVRCKTCRVTKRVHTCL